MLRHIEPSTYVREHNYYKPQDNPTTDKYFSEYHWFSKLLEFKRAKHLKAKKRCMSVFNRQHACLNLPVFVEIWRESIQKFYN